MDLNALKTAISDQGSFVLQYALVLVGVGTLSMALLELLKGLFFARRAYNRWSVRQWTARIGRSLGNLLTPGRTAPSEGPVLAQLELLAAGGHDYTDSLYDQPVEKLMGEIQAAVHVALDFPDLYPELYGFITEVDKSHLKDGASNNNTPARDSAIWKAGVTKVRDARARAAAGEPASATPGDGTQDAALARTRLTNLVSRRLDAFQVETQYFWDRLNQWASMLLGAIIFAAAGLSIAQGDAQTIAIILLALPAGIVAPFAKALVSNLSSFGK